ncbi:MAG: SMI1/KNR4 family protein [Gemmataceae bacterium]
MYDYQAWLNRANEFVHKLRSIPQVDIDTYEVGPPLSEAQLASLDRNLRIPLPGPIRKFLSGASLFDLNYYWDFDVPTPPAVLELFPGKSGINGGLTLCDCNDLVDQQRQMLEAVDEAEPHCLEIVRGCFPFATVGNGAQLCLLNGRDDGPVVYVEFLGHGCLQIAESFDSFLENWEGTGYLNPLGCPFEGPDFMLQALPARFLDGKSSGAAQFRQALGF